MGSVETDAQRQYCKSKKPFEPVYGILKEVNDPRLNFLNITMNLQMTKYIIDQIYKTSVADSDLDRAYFKYQILKIIVEPRVIAAAKHASEGRPLLAKYIKELKEAEKEVKEEADKILKAAGVKPTEEDRHTAKERLLSEIKKVYGGLFHLPSLSEELKKVEGKLQAGGGKSKFQRQAGYRPSYAAERRRSYKIDRSYAAKLGEREIKMFLTRRRNALKGIKKDVMCALMEIAHTLEQDEEFMSSIGDEDTIDFDKGLEVLSKKTGIEKPNAEVVKTVFKVLKVASEDVEISRKGGGGVLGIVFMLLMLCVAVSSSIFNGGKASSFDDQPVYSLPTWDAEGNKIYKDFMPYQFKPGGRTVFVRPRGGGTRRRSQVGQSLAGGGTAFSLLGVGAAAAAAAAAPVGAAAGSLVPGAGLQQMGGQVMVNPAGGALLGGAVLPAHVPPVSGRANAGPLNDEQTRAMVGLTINNLVLSANPSSGEVLDRWVKVSGARDAYAAQFQVDQYDVAQGGAVAQIVDAFSKQVVEASEKNKRQEGVRTLNAIRSAIVPYRAAVTELITNTETAGVIAAKELASLRTILRTFQPQHSNITYVETTDSDTVLRSGASMFSSGTARDINFMNNQEAEEFLGNFTKGSTWGGKEHFIGSVTVVTSAPSSSNRVRSALGSVDEAQVVYEPQTIFISVVHKTTEGIQERINGLKSDLANIQGQKDDFLKQDNVRNIEDNILAEKTHLEALEHNAKAVKEGKGAKRIIIPPAVEPTVVSSLKNSLGSVWSAASQAISRQLSNAPQAVVIDTVEGESDLDRTKRVEEFASLNKQIGESKDKITLLNTAKEGIQIQTKGFDERLAAKGEQYSDAVREKATGRYVEDGVIQLTRPNFSKLSPLVRRFLNANNELDVDWGLQYCDTVKDMISPLEAGLYLYNEKGVGASTLLVPDGISHELRIALLGFQRGESLKYRTALDTCLFNGINAFTSLRSIAPEQITEMGTALQLSTGQIDAFKGAVALASELAIVSGNLLQESRAASSPEMAIAILQGAANQLSAGPFDARARGNIFRVVENIAHAQGMNVLRLVNDTATEGINLVGGVVQIPGKVIGPITRTIPLIMLGFFGAFSFIGGSSTFALPINIILSSGIGLGQGFLEDIVAQNFGLTSSHYLKTALIFLNGLGFVFRLFEERKRRISSAAPAAAAGIPVDLANIEDKQYGWFSKPVWERTLEAIKKNIKTLHDTRSKTGAAVKAKKEGIKLSIKNDADASCRRFKTHTRLYESLPDPKPDRETLKYSAHETYLKLILGLNSVIQDDKDIVQIHTISQKEDEDALNAMLSGVTLDNLVETCKARASSGKTAVAAAGVGSLKSAAPKSKKAQSPTAGPVATLQAIINSHTGASNTAKDPNVRTAYNAMSPADKALVNALAQGHPVRASLLRTQPRSGAAAAPVMAILGQDASLPGSATPVSAGPSGSAGGGGRRVTQRQTRRRVKHARRTTRRN